MYAIRSYYVPLGGARLQAEARDRASALLRCAAQAWAAGQARDPAEALPVYLRDEVAKKPGAA